MHLPAALCVSHGTQLGTFDIPGGGIYCGWPKCRHALDKWFHGPRGTNANGRRAGDRGEGRGEALASGHSVLAVDVVHIWAWFLRGLCYRREFIDSTGSSAQLSVGVLIGVVCTLSDAFSHSRSLYSTVLVCVVELYSHSEHSIDSTVAQC